MVELCTLMHAIQTGKKYIMVTPQCFIAVGQVVLSSWFSHQTKSYYKFIIMLVGTILKITAKWIIS